MLEFRRSLPAYKERDVLLKAISENQVGRIYKLVSGFAKFSSVNLKWKSYSLLGPPTKISFVAQRDN